MLDKALHERTQVLSVRVADLEHLFCLLDVPLLVAAVAQVDEGGRVVAVGRARVLGVPLGLLQVALQEVEERQVGRRCRRNLRILES